MREAFLFYKSFYEAIRELPRDVQGEIYTAIMEYGLYGNETEQLKPIARSIFTLVKPQLDANMERYENGKKGGAPKGNKNNRYSKKDVDKYNQTTTNIQPTYNQHTTNIQPNYNVNDNVTDNVCLPTHTRTWEDVRSELYNSPIWRESVAKAHSLSDTDINGCIDGVVAYLSTQSDTPSIADAKRLFPKQVEIYKRTPRDSLDARLSKFKAEIADAKSKQGYTSEACNSFFQHWTQTNDNGVMRYEAELYWDTTKRLELWNR